MRGRCWLRLNPGIGFLDCQRLGSPIHPDFGSSRVSTDGGLPIHIDRFWLNPLRMASTGIDRLYSGFRFPGSHQVTHDLCARQLALIVAGDAVDNRDAARPFAPH